MTRLSDSEYPLSYLHGEYADKAMLAGRTPLTLTEWALDPAHSPAFQARLDVQAIRNTILSGECHTCHDEGFITVQVGGPDTFGNYDTDEIPCPMCTDTWTDRDDYEESLAAHHREVENEE